MDARPIPGQIVLDQQPAVRAHVVRERLRDRAAVEDVRPVFGDRAQRLGEVALDDAIGDRQEDARAWGDRAAAQEDGRGARKAREDREVQAKDETGVPIGLESLRGQRDGRLHHGLAGQRAEARVGQTQPGHDAGDADGPMADLVVFALHGRPAVLARRSAVGQQRVHVGPRRQRRAQTEVDDHLASSVMDHHRAHAPRAAHPRLHHTDRPRGGHRGVDGVAAAP